MERRNTARHFAYASTAPEQVLELTHVPAAACPGPDDDRHILAVVGFGEHNRVRADRPWQLQVGLPALNGCEGMLEVWRSREPARTVVAGDLVLRTAGDCAYGHLLLDEDRHGSLQAASHAAYAEMLRTLRLHGYEHLIRVWHYVSDIHVAEHGVERYHAFCIGRHQALSGTAGFESSLPAATAIGSRAPGLLMYFIAATSAGIQVENPRQVSAFRYPPQYGPKSPSFSRAVLKPWHQDRTLFVSGTASVVGHASRHRNDLPGQLLETIENLRTLVRCSDHSEGRKRPLRHDLQQIKVYLRDPGDYAQASALIERQLGTNVPAFYLRGDICRTDLLAEIEAVYRVTPAESTTQRR